MQHTLSLLPKLLLLFFAVSPLEGFQIPSLPLKDIQADSIEIEQARIVLSGHVSVLHEMGTVKSDHAVVSLQEKRKGSSGRTPTTIDLDGHVLIDFSDGSTLTAASGTILCQTREATFYGTNSEKVIYTSFCSEGAERVPVVASGKKLIAKIVKNKNGASSLSNIRGEGSVTIQYLRAEAKAPAATTNEEASK